MDTVLCHDISGSLHDIEIPPDVHKFIRVSRGILTPSECTTIIDIAETAGFTPVPVSYATNGKPIFTSHRRGQRVILTSRPFADALWQRVAHMIPVEWLGWPLYIKAGCMGPLSEDIQVLRYKNIGDGINTHADSQKFLADGGISCLTMLVYLNEGYTGAATHFQTSGRARGGGIAVVPTVGAVSVQDQSLLHWVPPLESGIKYVLRTDVYYRRR